MLVSYLRGRALNRNKHNPHRPPEAGKRCQLNDDDTATGNTRTILSKHYAHVPTGATLF